MHCTMYYVVQPPGRRSANKPRGRHFDWRECESVPRPDADKGLSTPTIGLLEEQKTPHSPDDRRFDPCPSSKSLHRAAAVHTMYLVIPTVPYRFSYRGLLGSAAVHCSTSSALDRHLWPRKGRPPSRNPNSPQTVLKVPHRWNEEITSPIIGLPPLPAAADPALPPSRLTTTAMALLAPAPP